MTKLHIRLAIMLTLIVALLIGTAWNRFQRRRERLRMMEQLAAAAHRIGPPPICGRDPVLDAWAGDIRTGVLEPLEASQRGFFERLFLGSPEMMEVQKPQQPKADGWSWHKPAAANADDLSGDDRDLRAFLSGEGVF